MHNLELETTVPPINKWAALNIKGGSELMFGEFFIFRNVFNWHGQMSKNYLNKDYWGEDVVKQEIDNSVGRIGEEWKGVEEPDVIARE